MALLSDIRRAGTVMAVVVSLVLIVGCSAEKRAQRHMKRAIRLDPSILAHKDTVIYETDTVIVPGVKADTVVVTQPVDTVTVERDRLVIRVIRESDTLRIEGECLPDTLIVQDTVRISYPQLTIRDAKRNGWLWFVAGFFTMALIVIGLAYFLRR